MEDVMARASSQHECCEQQIECQSKLQFEKDGYRQGSENVTDSLFVITEKNYLLHFLITVTHPVGRRCNITRVAGILSG